MTVKTRREARDLLEQRIEESGLKSKSFAIRILKRDPRIIRKWLDLSQHIPQIVLDFLEAPEPAPWPVEVDGNR